VQTKKGPRKKKKKKISDRTGRGATQAGLKDHIGPDALVRDLTDKIHCMYSVDKWQKLEPQHRNMEMRGANRHKRWEAVLSMDTPLET
jgi:hypothetical protein